MLSSAHDPNALSHRRFADRLGLCPGLLRRLLLLVGDTFGLLHGSPHRSLHGLLHLAGMLLVELVPQGIQRFLAGSVRLLHSAFLRKGGGCLGSVAAAVVTLWWWRG